MINLQVAKWRRKFPKSASSSRTVSSRFVLVIFRFFFHHLYFFTIEAEPRRVIRRLLPTVHFDSAPVKMLLRWDDLLGQSNKLIGNGKGANHRCLNSVAGASQFFPGSGSRFFWPAPAQAPLKKGFELLLTDINRFLKPVHS